MIEYAAMNQTVTAVSGKRQRSYDQTVDHIARVLLFPAQGPNGKWRVPGASFSDSKQAKDFLSALACAQ